MKYSEFKEQPVFDWVSFLDSKDHTLEQLNKACKLSSHWPTCACGNQCASIPRTQEGRPMDPVLRHHGVAFMDALTDMREMFCRGDSVRFEKARTEAKNAMVQIERRSTFLIIQKQNGE